MENDGIYYLIDPWVYGEKMALKYKVKDWKIWNITVYNQYGKIDSPFTRSGKLKLLKQMQESELYWDYDDCYYESEEWFKEKIKRWKKMD